MGSHDNEMMQLGEALVTPAGLAFRGRLYSCRRAIREGWFERALRDGEWRLPMAYSPERHELYAVCGNSGHEPCRSIRIAAYPETEKERYMVQFRELKERYRVVQAAGRSPRTEG